MTYRAFLVGKDGHIAQPPKIISADTDERAMEIAKQYVDGCDVELWDNDRKIALLTQDEK